MPFSKTPALLIFDCDGVLIDSEIIATGVHVDALAACGYPMTVEAYNSRFIGITDQQAYAIIEAETGRPLPDDYHEKAMAEIGRRYSTDLKAIAGIHAALDAIDLPGCVASSSNPDKLRLGLEIANLHARFTPNIFSAAQVAHGKPAPDLFLFAAERMGTEPADCLVIEDSVAGVQAAVAAGMPILGFVGGSHCPPEQATRLMREGALLTFGDMKDLPEIVNGLVSHML